MAFAQRLWTYSWVPLVLQSHCFSPSWTQWLPDDGGSGMAKWRTNSMRLKLKQNKLFGQQKWNAQLAWNTCSHLLQLLNCSQIAHHSWPCAPGCRKAPKLSMTLPLPCRIGSRPCKRAPQAILPVAHRKAFSNGVQLCTMYSESVSELEFLQNQNTLSAPLGRAENKGKQRDFVGTQELMPLVPNLPGPQAWFTSSGFSNEARLSSEHLRKFRMRKGWWILVDHGRLLQTPTISLYPKISRSVQFDDHVWLRTPISPENSAIIYLLQLQNCCPRWNLCLSEAQLALHRLSWYKLPLLPVTPKDPLGLTRKMS